MAVSVENGKISTDKLDQHQLASFEFSYMAAGISTTREGSALGVADREEQLAHLFLAETCEISNASTPYRIDGLTAERYRPDRRPPPCVNRTRIEFAPEKYEAVAKAIADGVRPAYGLSKDHEEIRAPFRKFAQEKVMPIAEKIHRHDMLVPEEIIQGLAEMGCFGLAIPEEYGGFDPTT